MSSRDIDRQTKQVTLRDIEDRARNIGAIFAAKQTAFASRHFAASLHGFIRITHVGREALCGKGFRASMKFARSVIREHSKRDRSTSRSLRSHSMRTASHTFPCMSLQASNTKR
ncbi:hypothetical protein BRPE64_ACDS23780 [Caballeronia insecticola]|uniref:Uncharacterized protein n=1 Tax=Caballeronia insecticola TaxID=758793 RepID=R4WZZ4_9BURK|nr:hypothetical protein BRPE64_ACDS23780 [Caballeronia insecticola]